MLDTARIQSALDHLGMNQSQLADACEVSREAVSNWMQGPSVPRPAKLRRLAQVLGLTVEALLGTQDIPEPLVSVRTRKNEPVAPDARDAALDMGGGIQQLLPFFPERDRLIAPRQLLRPVYTPEAVRAIAGALRDNVGLGPEEGVGLADLLKLYGDFGVVLVPVIWQGKREGHEHVVCGYLPESRTPWVHVDLKCPADELLHWLAYGLGQALTLPHLPRETCARFSDAFARELQVPRAAVTKFLASARAVSDAAAMAGLVQEVAQALSVSVGLVLQVLALEVDGTDPLVRRARAARSIWRQARSAQPSCAQRLFGTEDPHPEDFVPAVEALFGTEVYRAIQARQKEEGGRDVAFISCVLGLWLLEARTLSQVLWARVATTDTK